MYVFTYARILHMEFLYVPEKGMIYLKKDGKYSDFGFPVNSEIKNEKDMRFFSHLRFGYDEPTFSMEPVENQTFNFGKPVEKQVEPQKRSVQTKKRKSIDESFDSNQEDDSFVVNTSESVTCETSETSESSYKSTDFDSSDKPDQNKDEKAFVFPEPEKPCDSDEVFYITLSDGRVVPCWKPLKHETPIETQPKRKEINLTKDDKRVVSYSSDSYMVYEPDTENAWRYYRIIYEGKKIRYVYVRGVYYHWVYRHGKASSYSRDPSFSEGQIAKKIY